MNTLEFYSLKTLMIYKLQQLLYMKNRGKSRQLLSAVAGNLSLSA